MERSGFVGVIQAVPGQEALNPGPLYVGQLDGHPYAGAPVVHHRPRALGEIGERAAGLVGGAADAVPAGYGELRVTLGCDPAAPGPLPLQAEGPVPVVHVGQVVQLDEPHALEHQAVVLVQADGDGVHPGDVLRHGQQEGGAGVGPQAGLGHVLVEVVVAHIAGRQPLHLPDGGLEPGGGDGVVVVAFRPLHILVELDVPVALPEADRVGAGQAQGVGVLDGDGAVFVHIAVAARHQLHRVGGQGGGVGGGVHTSEVKNRAGLLFGGNQVVAGVHVGGVAYVIAVESPEALAAPVLNGGLDFPGGLCDGEPIHDQGV